MTPTPHWCYSITLHHYNSHRPHRSVDQQPPTARTPHLRPLRRDRLAGLLHEYLQVASVAVGRWGGRDVVMSASQDATVPIWHQGGCWQVLDLLEAASCVALTDNSRIYVASGSDLCMGLTRNSEAER